jgi:hypothetical protein
VLKPKIVTYFLSLLPVVLFFPLFQIIPYFIGYASAFSLSLNLEFPYSLNYPHGGPAMAAAVAAYCVEGQRHQRGIS